jgi:hypothetical protein
MRDYRTDAALRPQPKRDGPDFWPTPDCLTGALVKYILPALPLAPIWECAAGDGALVRALEAAGRTVIATDLYTTGHDFLATPPPPDCYSLITNPPHNLLNEFLNRTLELLEAPDNSLTMTTLLLRWDHLMAGTRGTTALQRAYRILVCAWRPTWIPGTTGNPRWISTWITWLRGYRGPPVTRWVTQDKAHRQRTNRKEPT